MDPQAAFDGLSTTDWAARLCVLLIEQQPHIEETLSRDRRYADFCDGITRWKADFLERSRTLEGTAQELWDLCLSFGVIDWMCGQGLVSGPGAPRTRGRAGAAPLPAGTPRAPDFARVAALYLRPAE